MRLFVPFSKIVVNIGRNFTYNNAMIATFIFQAMLSLKECYIKK